MLRKETSMGWVLVGQPRMGENYIRNYGAEQIHGRKSGYLNMLV